MGPPENEEDAKMKMITPEMHSRIVEGVCARVTVGDHRVRWSEGRGYETSSVQGWAYGEGYGWRPTTQRVAESLMPDLPSRIDALRWRNDGYRVDNDVTPRWVIL